MSEEEKIIEVESTQTGSVEEDVIEEESDKEFVFAMAPIIRVMRSELDSDKLIRSRVKKEMNLWLEKMCRKIARKINESDYTVVELVDFKKAIEPYEMIDDLEGERKRILATLEKVKQDCDSLIRDVNRKFITPDSIDMDIGFDREEEELE